MREQAGPLVLLGWHLLGNTIPTAVWSAETHATVNHDVASIRGLLRNLAGIPARLAVRQGGRQQPPSARPGAAGAMGGRGCPLARKVSRK
jgi:hypothetical protein